MFHHLTRFLLGTAVALVCVLFYRSIVINGGGNYEISVKAFALSNATQASNNGESGNEVASFDEKSILLSREDQVDQSTVSNDTLQKVCDDATLLCVIFFLY